MWVGPGGFDMLRIATIGDLLLRPLPEPEQRNGRNSSLSPETAQNGLFERRSRHNGLLNYDARREGITLLVKLAAKSWDNTPSSVPALAAGETGILIDLLLVALQHRDVATSLLPSVSVFPFCGHSRNRSLKLPGKH